MAKFTLKPPATFKRVVELRTHDGKTATLELEFRHRGAKALEALYAELKDKGAVETIMAMVVGWELSDPFDAETVAQLVDDYMDVALDILEAYAKGLRREREGN